MRPKAIVYSLFGYKKERQANCFDFNSYLRGLMENVRLCRLIYPDWEIVLETDKDTYKGFQYLFDNIGITVNINEPAPLCLAMLWRLKPAFEQELGKWKYSHIICRDLDSPVTYREAQAVKYWINRDRAVHAITDSVSHNLPMLGGMIGVKPDYFTERIGCATWKEMISKVEGLDYSRKGTDQTFLNKFVYPKFAQPGSDSITQHYFNGMGNTFLGDFRTCTCPPPSGHESHCINNIELEIPFALSESNSICGHIGSAGAYSSALLKFLHKYKDQFKDLIEIEKEYEDIFYWTKDGSYD